MNPYVYSRRKRGQSQEAPSPVSSHLGAWSLVKEVINAPVGAALAFAMILFASGSVASMTAMAYPEVAMGNDSVMVHSQQLRPLEQVLGDSIVAGAIDDVSLEAALPVGSLAAKPLSYDSGVGRWNYQISYRLYASSSTAGISIGTYSLQTGLSGSGSVETGSILKPATRYLVYLWTQDSSGAKITLARLEIKTQKGKASDNSQNFFSPCLQNNQATSTPSLSTSTTTNPMMCMKTKEGKILCPKPIFCGIIRGERGASSTMPGFPPKPLRGDGTGTPEHMPPLSTNTQGQH